VRQSLQEHPPTRRYMGLTVRTSARSIISSSTRCPVALPKCYTRAKNQGALAPHQAVAPYFKGNPEELYCVTFESMLRVRVKT
jgi:hypothetical protein